MDQKSDIIEKRKKKLLDLQRNNINLYPNDFVVLHTVGDIKKAVEDVSDSLDEEGPVFVVAGRMMAINRFGKASFIRFRDRTGQLQAYVRKDKIGEKAYNLFKQLDIGDFVGLNGVMFKTPMMQPVPGGAEATPFVTHHNALGMDLFLRIAPELYLKRLVIGGFERVFEINRSFRNEGVSTRHNPEFTMLEFYQAFARYEDLMDLTEEMFCHVARVVTGSTSIQYQGNIIDLGVKWRRISLASAMEEFGGIDAGLMNNREGLLEFAASNRIKVTKTGRLGKIITKIFDVIVEPKLLQPTFITGYPVEVSPLSRRSDTSPELTDRFELFISGHEIANGFSELNDPNDQKQRFLQQVEDREAGDREAHYMDKDYIEALEYGMPPTAGEGIGIDRLTMLFTDSASIREVILFPHMKPVERGN